MQHGSELRGKYILTKGSPAPKGKKKKRGGGAGGRKKRLNIEEELWHLLAKVSQVVPPRSSRGMGIREDFRASRRKHPSAQLARQEKREAIGGGRGGETKKTVVWLSR